MANERNKKVRDEEIIRLIRENGAPFVTADELAEGLPITRQGVGYRLNDLHDRGIVGKKKVGGRRVGWWLIED